MHRPDRFAGAGYGRQHRGAGPPVVARRDPQPRIPLLGRKVEIKPAELKMAGPVVESMAEDFNPDRYHDT